MIDVIIIGAGPGGYEAALYGASKGLNVVLVNKHNLGGTCLHYGCIPTKSYFKHASLISDLKDSDLYGLANLSYAFDFGKVKSRKDEVVSSLEKGISFLLKKANVTVLEGKANFIGDKKIEVNGETYEAKNIIIATGSKERILPNFDSYLTSKDILGLDKLPESLTIVGGGVIGVEFASILNQFGVKVEVLEYGDRILNSLDQETSRRILSLLKRQGVDVHLNIKVNSYQDKVLTYEEKGELKTKEVENLLLAIGRIPNLDCALDKTNIIYSNKGIIVDKNFETNVKGVYAIGDVTGINMLAHYATYSGYRAINHILDIKDEIDFNLVPACIFSLPEIASVGILEGNELKANYRGNGKALASNLLEGYIKLYVNEEKIVGGIIIGHEASILIHEIAAVIKEKVTVSKFKDYIHAHPTLSEIYRDCFK